MNHEAYENEMIDIVNRNAEEKSKCPVDTVTKRSLFTKTDAANLIKGLKCMVLALFTAGLFAVAVFGFIMVASVTGYLAVAVFTTSIGILAVAFIFLYALGITFKTNTESQGDDK